MQPPIQYARSGDVNIAYQVLGEGPIDLVIVPGWVSHLEILWEEPEAAAFLRRLGRFSRVILFDKRGTGMSDPLTGASSIDERMDDVRAVMDAAHSERAALFGYSEGGALSLVFAASHPERVSAVVCYAALARMLRAPDYPFGRSEEDVRGFLEGAARAATDGDLYDVVTPSRKGDEQFRRWFARIVRLAVSPAMMALLIRTNAVMDIRPLLPSVRVPTLVLHRRDDQLVRVEHGRYLGEHVPGAKYVELGGGDHWPWFGDTDAVVGEIEEFVTGMRHVAASDRILATVMFTDIVGSTECLAEMGDARWRRTLDHHDAIIARQIERFRGRQVKHTGDGVLATFDAPARAVQCADAIREGTRAIGVEVRAGVHTGECELRGADIGGLAVHITARVAEIAGPGEILVSSTVKDLVVGSGISFAERGAQRLKGVPDEWRLFSVIRSA